MIDMSRDSQPSPELFLKAVMAYRDSAAIKGAVELDVFTALGQGADTAKTLAERCQTDPRGMRILCDYLCVMGLLEKSGSSYSLTGDSAVFLDRNSPAYMGDVVDFLLDPFFIRDIGDVASAVRKGGVATSVAGSDVPGHPMWVTFARSMTSLNRMPAALLADLICADLGGTNFGDRVSTLDIAAGSGIFGITLAQKHPGAEIFAVDWPNVLEVAQENARQAGLGQRYHAIPGSAFEVETGTGYKVILLCNFLHHFDAATCSKFLARMKDALAADGKIYTLEFVPNEDRISPPFVAGFDLHMLRQTPAGDTYTAGEYSEIFAVAGLQVTAVNPLTGSAYTAIVAGQKQ